MLFSYLQLRLLLVSYFLRDRVCVSGWNMQAHVKVTSCDEAQEEREKYESPCVTSPCSRWFSVISVIFHLICLTCSTIHEKNKRLLVVYVKLDVIIGRSVHLYFSEPIIKPVSKKKFFHAEQDLPTTNYDIEYV